MISNQCSFNCYYISFQDLQSFSEFLVSVINHYHINGLHLFWDIFKWFCLQISSDTKYFFLSCPRYCDWRLIVVIVYYFQIWNKKKHNIISSRVISSHIGPMYIETPCIYTFTEWAEMVGHSHGSNVYLDTLYIYIYWVGRNDRAITWVPCILRHLVYIQILNGQK